MTHQERTVADSDRLAMPLTMALDDPAATLERVGGKGASLARLAAAGLPVPAGFHITTAAYRRFVAQNELQPEILAAVSAVDPEQPATLEAASQRIGALFAARTMPDDIAAAIRAAYAELGGGDLPVAVRSSATAEDLPDMSFAGQQETFLNMRGEAMVLEAVKRCWASLWTARAIGYRARHGISPADVSLAVVVQELVPADAAGILFTADPLTGAREQAMINAAWGLGEAVVGGQVTPDTVVVDRASGTIAAEQIAEKDVMTVRTPEGTREVPVPAEQRARAVLSRAQAAELARLGTRIEELYGRPMDIEWAIHDGRVSILQARPITALPEPTGSPATATAEWTLPDPKGRYMRASVFELLPDPLSPLFATLGLPAWEQAYGEFGVRMGLGDFFISEGFLATVNGYGYYNLTLSPRQTAQATRWMARFMARAPGLFRTALARWQEARASLAQRVERLEALDLPAASAATLLEEARGLTEEAARYYVSVQSGILPVAYMSEAAFSWGYDRLLKRRDDPAALTFMLGFDSEPIRAEKSLYDLAQWARGEPELAAALQEMSSEQFVAAFREQQDGAEQSGAWPEFWRRLREHLARFGHAIYDLDFAKPLLVDDPSPVLEALKYFLSGRAPDPYARQATAADARERATRTVLSRQRGLRWRLAWWLLDSAQRYAPLREDALADAGLGWPVLRRMLRELGSRLAAAGAVDAPDDVFWLTIDDLQAAAGALDAGRAPEDLHSAVAERRAVWQRQRAQTPPPALPIKGGARFLGVDLSGVMPARLDQAAGKVLKGVAASPGRVTAAARVIHGPEEFGDMQQGAILVARITTPAWTPLFALAAGVVTDIGGPLSHSSIVAREYHIPAVLGTGVATERLHSDQNVTVDGDAGTVTAD